MTCPLAEAFTKSPLVVYQNLLKEFWCTAIAYHPNLPTDDSEICPLKEYLIKFSAMSDRKPLTLDFKTLIESTRLDYAKGKYASHPSTEEVMSELAKIVDNLILLDRTPEVTLKPRGPVTRERQFSGKDSVGNKQPIDTGLPSTVSDEGTVKTTLLPEGPHGDKDSKGLKLPTDMEPLTNPVADPLGIDAKYQADQTQSAGLRYQSMIKNEGKTSSKASDNKEVFAARKEMNEDIPPTDKEAQSLPPNKEQPESSHAEDSDSDSSCPDALKKDDLLKALNGVIETLKVVQEAVKDDPALKKVIKAT
nr:hypothetical protein [Tanacetum cinerariifolium]